ncbi:RagB/SusD family nutrient uptake outer membrane protein [Mesonia aestuariivivens]|uniref:RagB/SusD family nutrient uptake outer membrane protein n=1 Tax=Mesonia aestuariivivens TaxID=2796128 RepID=A0ABS6VYB4_9FLAO|nr:RagB/SusD family nutrient uptake outer membrane protein [Mesonia aestuariivivens]MBW2960586.1 RagB/SusD family nutrient uptake outer membrane protein [Mesonia aestuariivivens]
MKKKLYTASLLLLILFQWSCSDFLEQEPGSQISIKEQLSTRKGMLEAVVGMYSLVEENTRFENYAVYGDLNGGNIKFTPNLPSAQVEVVSKIQEIYNFNDKARESNLEIFYKNAYRIITAANLLIENVENTPFFTIVEQDQIYAEALSVRAYTHFLLLQVYAQNTNFSEAEKLGIVYKTETLQEELKYAPRLSLAESYVAIVNDLQKSLDLFSDTPILEGPEYSYFREVSVKALLARVQLAQEDYPSALENAKSVIENSGVVLTSKQEYISSWKQPLQPIPEILLEFSVSVDSDGNLSGSKSAIYGYTSNTKYANYAASQDLLNLYTENDIRGDLFLEQQLPTLENNETVNKPYYFTHKFQGNPGNPVFRLSEMYLIAAEAAAQLNENSTALNYLNAIRERAGLTSLTNNNNLKEEIFLEYRRELAFENKLFFDIKRLGKNVTRNDGCISTSCNLNYPSPFFVLPIPQETININTNLIQNEGY